MECDPLAVLEIWLHFGGAKNLKWSMAIILLFTPRTVSKPIFITNYKSKVLFLEVVIIIRGF